jgi:hypothetical protein
MIECSQTPEELVVRISGTMSRVELDRLSATLDGSRSARTVFDVTGASHACLRYVPSFVAVMRRAKRADVRIVVATKLQHEAVQGVLAAFPHDGSCAVRLAPACRSPDDYAPTRASCAASRS